MPQALPRRALRAAPKLPARFRPRSRAANLEDEVPPLPLAGDDAGAFRDGLLVEEVRELALGRHGGRASERRSVLRGKRAGAIGRRAAAQRRLSRAARRARSVAPSPQARSVSSSSSTVHTAGAAAAARCLGHALPAWHILLDILRSRPPPWPAAGVRLGGLPRGHGRHPPGGVAAGHPGWRQGRQGDRSGGGRAAQRARGSR